jgi:hypothetical protein
VSESGKERRFDPYLIWLGIRDPRRPPHHYRLLGLELFEDDPEVIQNAADRQISYVRRFLVGEHAPEAQQVLQELIAARACLLDRKAKASYDATLKNELAAAGFSAASVLSSPVAAEGERTPKGFSLLAVFDRVGAFLSKGTRQLLGPSLIRGEEEPSDTIPEPAEVSRSEREERELLELIRRYVYTGGTLVVLALFLVLGISLLQRLPRSELADVGPTLEDSLSTSLADLGKVAFQDGPGEAVPLTPGPGKISSSVEPEAPQTGPGDVGEAGAGEMTPHSSEETMEVGEKPQNPPLPQEAGQSAGEGPGMSERVPEGPQEGELDSWRPGTASGATRVPLPDPDAVAAAGEHWRARMAEIGSSEINRELAEQTIRKLLADARGAETAAERYAALELAAKWALRAEATPLLREVIEELSSAFQVTRGELLKNLLSGLDGERVSNQFRRDLALLLMLQGEAAADEGDFESARWCLATAESFSQQGKDPVLAETIADRAKLLPVAEKAYREAAEAHKRLQSVPDDPQAHTTVGVYLCFHRSQPRWNEGLSHLARGADPLLRELAEAELHLSPDAPAKEKVALGDRWQKAAEQAPAELRSAFLARAAHWYRLALPETTGFTRLRLENFLNKMKAGSL